MLVFGVCIKLIRDTIYQGNDFNVFWRAGQYLWAGESLYSTARDGAMVYKYPPWTVLFFAPFGFLPGYWARLLWGVLQVLCLAYVWRWLSDLKISKASLWITTFGFWGIWVVHALNGQINLMMLVIALWAGTAIIQDRSRRMHWFALTWALSIKIFTVFPLLGLMKNLPRWQWILASIAGLVGLCIIPWWLSDLSPQGFLMSWIDAAGSGGNLLEGDLVRGRDNQGLPAFLMRAFSVPGTHSNADILAFLVVSVLAGAWWWRTSRNLDPLDQWLGWLALTPVVHPLAWFHLYVFCFPVLALTVARAWHKSLFLKFFAVIGFLLTAAITRKTLGQLGWELEMLSIKSLGVLLSLSVFKQVSKNLLSNDGC